MAAVKAEGPRKYELNAVVDAFRLIAKILEVNGSIGLTQLSGIMRLSKNKTFRLLTTLNQCGLVEKSQQNNYSIGLASIGLAHRIMTKASLMNNIRPYMEELVKVVNEAVYFARYHAEEAVLVDFVDCHQPIKATSFVGKAIRHPISTRLVTRDCSVAMIGDIAVDVGSLNPDITTVSIPCLVTNGMNMGALVVLAPTYRMPLERIKTEIVPALRDVMQRQQLQFFDSEQDRLLPSSPPVERDYGKYSHIVAGGIAAKIANGLSIARAGN